MSYKKEKKASIMKYRNNYFGQTTEQNVKIKEIKSRHTILSEYLNEVFDYMRTQGIDIVLHRVPCEFKLDGHRGAGWYGNVEGTITNHNNDHEIYADAIWGGCFNNFTDNEPIINLTTGGGNGGPKFNFFERTFISVDMLPLLKNIPLDVELVEKDTKELNALIDPVYSAYYRATSDRRDELMKSTEIVQIENIIKNCKKYDHVNGLYWILQKAERVHSSASSYCGAEADREFQYELPPIKGVYTTTKNYYYKKHSIALNIKRFTEEPIYQEVIDEYKLFLEENAEKFV